jgi:hypothetical protein
MSACCAGAAGPGPGFATPLDAYRSGQRERLAYVPVTSFDHARPDYLATVDVDPESPTHSQARASARACARVVRMMVMPRERKRIASAV